MENDYVATSVRDSSAKESVQPGRDDARSSQPNGTVHVLRMLGDGLHRPWSSGRGPRRRIPERKQVSCCQAFIIASSLWPFRCGVRADLPRWPARNRTRMKDVVCR